MVTELQFVAIAAFLLWGLVSSVCGMLKPAEEPARLVWRERCPVGWGAWREVHFGLTAADRRVLLQQEPAVDRVAVDGLFRAVLSQDPNPDAVLIFVADHISIPADVRRMDLTDKERYERIREAMGKYAAIIELGRVEEGDAVRWIQEHCGTREAKIDPDAARELVDSLGGDMMMISNELEKLMLYVGEKKRITLGDVETMVLAAKQRSLYELTDAISARERTRALEVLDAILSTGEGEEAAIGHLYMLAKTFRQMLVILERNVRDQRMLWAALWQGFRVPPFAADDIIRQARRYKSKRELTRAIRLVAKADLALRSNPPSKRLVLEKLILDLTAQETALVWSPRRSR